MTHAEMVREIGRTGWVYFGWNDDETAIYIRRGRLLLGREVNYTLAGREWWAEKARARRDLVEAARLLGPAEER